MTTAEEPIVQAAGAETVETPEVATPEATTAQPVTQDPEQLDRWAIGRAMELRPELFVQQPVKDTPTVEATPGHPDVPKHPNYDRWVEEGNQDAIDAYVGAVKVMNAKIAQTGGDSADRVARIEQLMARNSCVQHAASMVPVGARQFLDKAVADLERENGNPIPGDNPMLRRIVADRAELMYLKSGGTKPAVGETNGVSSQHAPGLTKDLKDTWLPLFKQSGYPGTGPGGFMTDAELLTELKNMGEVK